MVKMVNIFQATYTNNVNVQDTLGGRHQGEVDDVRDRPDRIVCEEKRHKLLFKPDGCRTVVPAGGALCNQWTSKSPSQAQHKAKQADRPAAGP